MRNWLVILCLGTLSFASSGQAEMTRQKVIQKWPETFCYGEYISYFPYGGGCNGSLKKVIKELQPEVKNFLQVIKNGGPKAVYSGAPYIHIRDFRPDKSAKRLRIYMPVKMMPELLKKAFILEYDKHFYERGQAFNRPPEYVIGKEILAASIKNKFPKNKQPFSHFTRILLQMQFYRNKHQPDFTTGIIRQFVVARLIESSGKYPHEDVLDFYLNSAYLGRGYWGVASVSLQRFGKSPEKLSLAEIAMITIMNRGARYYIFDQKVHKRVIAARNKLIDKMKSASLISAQEAKAAKAEIVKILQ